MRCNDIVRPIIPTRQPGNPGLRAYATAEEQSSLLGLDIQTTAPVVQDYLFRYTPLPTACVAPQCTGYVLTATPTRALAERYRRYKSRARSFFIDDSGTIRHCEGIEADATDPPIDQAPTRC